MILRKLTSDQKDLPQNPPSYQDVQSSDSSPSLTPVTSQNERSIRPNLLKSISSNKIEQPKNVLNKPYKPAKHLQSHIDNLGGSNLNLTTISTDARTEYFDVLPSFQMYQSILKRNDFEFNEGSLGSPPVYGDSSQTSSSQSFPQTLDTHGSISQNVRNSNLGEDLDENLEGQYLFSDNESEDGLQSRPRLRESAAQRLSGNGDNDRSGSRVAGAVTHESYGHSVLDNIDMLPHAKSSPLSINIYVTKDVPHPNMPSELETKLKEYSSGDVVNGYIVITNTSDDDVDFGLFMVSLECTIKAVYAKMEKSYLKPHTILQKKPLKMYDLNASFNEGEVPSSAGIEYAYLSQDQADGCIIGLPNNRILKAKTKYKKFILFKFPEMLLDNSCPHGVLRHLMPPPSFGLDQTSFQNRASLIEVNKTLGYGFLNNKGSPIKLKDYAFDDVSVSYAIEAKFIDKLHTKDQRTPVFENDINNPENSSQYIISKSAQFFLRFIPNIKTQVSTYSKVYDLFDQVTFDKMGIDGVLYTKLANKETWRFIERMNLTIVSEIQSALDRQETAGNDLKLKNLNVQHSSVASNDYTISNDVNIHSNFLPSHVISKLESSRVIFTNTGVTVYGKKKKRLLSTTAKIGEVVLCVKVPDKLIPYGSPKLIQKYNDGKMVSTPLSPTSSKSEFFSLQPISSNMSELYNREESSLITSIDIDLYFKASEHDIRPPSIASVEFNVVAWTYRTDYPIPISFEHDFFYTEPHVSGAIVQRDDVESTKQNLHKLKELVDHYIDFLKETKTYISQNTYSYLKGLSKMGVKKDTIKGYFQNVHSSPAFDSADWKCENSESEVILWHKTLTVPLKAYNKNNITLPPNFQSCLVGRLYALQVLVKFKNGEETQNIVEVNVPAIVG